MVVGDVLVRVRVGNVAHMVRVRVTVIGALGLWVTLVFVHSITKSAKSGWCTVPGSNNWVSRMIEFGDMVRVHIRFGIRFRIRLRVGAELWL